MVIVCAHHNTMTHGRIYVCARANHNMKGGCTAFSLHGSRCVSTIMQLFLCIKGITILLCDPQNESGAGGLHGGAQYPRADRHDG